jgi:hypothetical protein
MTSHPGQRKPSAQFVAGYRLGLADARTGGMTLICGGPEVAEKAAGYAAGLLAGGRQRQAEHEPEAGS